jgi:hypothetical protein
MRRSVATCVALLWNHTVCRSSRNASQMRCGSTCTCCVASPALLPDAALAMALELCRLVVRVVVIVAVALADRQRVVARLAATPSMLTLSSTPRRLRTDRAALFKHPATRVVHLAQQRAAPPSASPT